MRRLTVLTTTAALALSVAAPVAAADVQLPTEPMSAEDIAVIDAGIAAIMDARAAA